MAWTWRDRRSRIHALVKGLGIEKAVVVGHDIGLMVAYAYAAQFPIRDGEAGADGRLPAGCRRLGGDLQQPGDLALPLQWADAEALVKGRERIYFDHFWNDFAADPKQSIPEAVRRAYTTAYARPGRMRAAWAYFVSFPQAAKDFARLSQTRLNMPVLSIGGEKANGSALAEQVKLVATNATSVVLSDTGHWVMEENPRETTDALMRFLNAAPASAADDFFATFAISWPIPMKPEPTPQVRAFVTYAQIPPVGELNRIGEQRRGDARSHLD